MSQLIQNGAEPDKEWRPDVFHRVDPSLVGPKKHWWFQAVNGVLVLGEDKPRRTKGRPTTAWRAWRNFGEHVEEATRDFIIHYGPLYSYTPELDEHRVVEEGRHREFQALVLATFMTECGGRTQGDRYESHIRDWSFGGAQFLTSTAKAVGKLMGMDVPAKSMKEDPSDANKAAWKKFLEDPENATYLMVQYHFSNNQRFALKGDPILLYSTYNAGSPRPSKQTKFGLVYYDPDLVGPKPGATDHFASWYGDACAVLDLA